MKLSSSWAKILVDDVLVRDMLEKLRQSMRRQILRLRLEAVKLEDFVEGLLGLVQRDCRNTPLVLDDDRRPLSRPASCWLVGEQRVERVNVFHKIA